MLRQDRLSSILDHGRLTVPTVPTHRPVPPSSHLDLPHPKLPVNRPASPSGTSPTSKTLLPQPGPLKVGPADLKSLVAGGRPAECGIDGSGMGGSRRAVPRTHQPRNQPAPQLQDFKEGNLQSALYLTHFTTSPWIKTLSDLLHFNFPSISHHCLSTRYWPTSYIIYRFCHLSLHCFGHSFHVKIPLSEHSDFLFTFWQSFISQPGVLDSFPLTFVSERGNTPSSAANLSLIPLIFIVTYLFVPFDSISGPSLPPGPAPTPFPSSSPSPFPPSPPPPSGHGPFPHLPNSLLPPSLLLAPVPSYTRGFGCW